MACMYGMYSSYVCMVCMYKYRARIRCVARVRVLIGGCGGCPPATNRAARSQIELSSRDTDFLRVWYGMVWYGMVWYGMVWYGMVWYGMVWYSMVWYGIVWYGMVWYGMVW